jgi:seryl-tRNA(Sec) selenium transferase
MDVCHKIMQILDDNAQQVPEGFYLEVCDQLKHLHVAVERYEPDERELGLNEAERMLNRKAEKLKEDREHLNECVLNYNKTATAYLEKVKKYNKAAASVKRVRAWQLAREARLDDREDNITLAQLQRTLILAE